MEYTTPTTVKSRRVNQVSPAIKLWTVSSHHTKNTIPTFEKCFI